MPLCVVRQEKYELIFCAKCEYGCPIPLIKSDFSGARLGYTTAVASFVRVHGRVGRTLDVLLCFSSKRSFAIINIVSTTWSVILTGPAPMTDGINGTLKRGSCDVSGDDC